MFIGVHIRKVLATATVLLFYAGLAAVTAEKTFDEGGRTAVDATAGATEETAAVSEAAAGETSGPATGGAEAAPAPGESTGTVGEPGVSVSPSGPAGSTEGGGTGAEPAPAGGTPTTVAAGTPVKAGAGTIVVGVHDDNPGAAFGQFGVRGGPAGDQQVWIRKVVDWINANGGMGGRKVQLITHITASLEGTFDEQAEKACTYFTEDNNAAVVVSGARVPTLNLVDCLARHDTPLVWDYHYMADRATLARYANHLYMPSMVSAERLGVWIDAVADAGFFRDSTGIGLVRYDEPIARRLADAVIRPRLAAKGLSVKEEAAFRPAAAASSAADLSAQANNAILRFRTSSVNKVIIQPSSAVLPLLFFAAAEGQTYRPDYTYTSYDVPMFQTANAPDSQLDGSMLFGWIPAGDVEQPQYPPQNATARRCLSIMAGNTPVNDGPARRYCNGLLFLKAVFDRGAQPTPADMRRVIDGMGQWESAWTFATALGPNRHDGASVGRLVVYDTGCSCYVYRGPDRPIP